MTHEKNRRLQELGGSGYEVADGQPNIKGWDVKLSSGEKVGEVDELIFDEEALKVRYLVLDIDSDKDLSLESRDVLIPIGLARLDEKDDDVILTGVSLQHLRSLPEYDKEDLNSRAEYQVRNIFRGNPDIATPENYETNAEFYNDEYYHDENLFRNRTQNFPGAERTGYPETSEKTSHRNMPRERTSYRDEKNERKSIPVVEEHVEIGKREVQRGGVRLRSRIVENEVNEKVNLREEHVNVERTPANRPATEADFREDVIEITEKAEVPVINKEARVVEEVKVNKEVNERNEIVKDKVRKKEVDVEKLDKDKKNFDKR